MVFKNVSLDCRACNLIFWSLMERHWQACKHISLDWCSCTYLQVLRNLLFVTIFFPYLWQVGSILLRCRMPQLSWSSFVDWLSMEGHSGLVPRALGAGQILAEHGDMGTYTSGARELKIGLEGLGESLVPIHLALSMELHHGLIRQIRLSILTQQPHA